MNLGMLLDMAADGLADRVALGRGADGISFAELRTRAPPGGRLSGRLRR